MYNDQITEIAQSLILQFQHPQIPVEYARYLQYALFFIIPCLLALVLTPIIGKIANDLDIRNDTKTFTKNKLNRYENNSRRVKKTRIPLLGGLAVILPLLVLIPLFFGFNEITIPILIAISILTIAGIIDDIYNLPGSIQLLAQLAAAFIFAASVVNLEVIKIPFDGFIDLSMYTWNGNIMGLPWEFVFPGDLIAMFWVVVAINAIKWVSGLDALMESNLIVGFFMIFIIAARGEAALVLLLSAMLTGGLAGFTFYNFPPAKIMSAATGKTVYGFLVAALALLNDTKLAITILIMLLPLVDFLFVVTKRFIVNRPKSFKETILTPFRLLRISDTNHIHHQLLKLGFSTKQILLLETSITLLAGSIAVLTTEAYRLFFILVGGTLMLLFLTILHVKTSKIQKPVEEKEDKPEKRPPEPPKGSPESRYSY
ncbi:MAG: MraY family glycosyltransferase [Candidatus Dojkabacteria bacterium]|nr:MAG: MraY family glycosyltransferase [Candidatus Dojkabacteria bacterium]